MSIGSNTATFIFLMLTLLSALPVYTVPAPLRTVGKVVDRVMKTEQLLAKRADETPTVTTTTTALAAETTGSTTTSSAAPSIIDADLTKGSIVFDGQDCVAVDADIQVEEANRKGTIKISYKGLYGHVNQPSFTDLAICTVHFTFKINTGWKLTITGADIVGYFDLQEGVTANAETLIAMDDSASTKSYSTVVTKTSPNEGANKTLSYDNMSATYHCPTSMDIVSNGQKIPSEHKFMMTNKVFLTNTATVNQSVFGIDPKSSEYASNSMNKAYTLNYKYDLKWCGN